MRVAVIGAGPAGLAFADRLTSIKQDVHIDIFERSDHIGGISKTVVYKGNRIDIGGHRFFSKSDEVMNWWTNKFPIDLTNDNDQSLITYRNSLKNIEFLSECHQLQYLNLSQNQIHDISPISNLKNLIDLNLEINQITSIPITMENPLLQTLNLSNNKIEKIQNFNQLE